MRSFVSHSSEPLLLDTNSNSNFVSARITPRVWACFSTSSYNFNDAEDILSSRSCPTKLAAKKKKRLG